MRSASSSCHASEARETRCPGDNSVAAKTVDALQSRTRARDEGGELHGAERHSVLSVLRRQFAIQRVLLVARKVLLRGGGGRIVPHPIRGQPIDKAIEGR